jgi:hypothetical protein
MHVLVAGATIVAVLSSAVLDSVALAGILICSATVPVLGMWLVERRASSRTRPVLWPLRSAAVGVPQSLAIGVAAGLDGGTSSAVAGAAGAVALLAPLAAASMASRTLRSPLTADLGELDIEIMDKIRVLGPGLNRWSASDYASITRDELQITLWPDLRTARRYTFPLETIEEVTVRAATEYENPWITLDTGQTYGIPGGTIVLALTHSRGRGILPVYRPHEFAELLNVRRRAVARRQV